MILKAGDLLIPLSVPLHRSSPKLCSPLLIKLQPLLMKILSHSLKS